MVKAFILLLILNLGAGGEALSKSLKDTWSEEDLIDAFYRGKVKSLDDLKRLKAKLPEASTFKDSFFFKNSSFIDKAILHVDKCIKYGKYDFPTSKTAKCDLPISKDPYVFKIGHGVSKDIQKYRNCVIARQIEPDNLDVLVKQNLGWGIAHLCLKGFAPREKRGMLDYLIESIENKVENIDFRTCNFSTSSILSGICAGRKREIKKFSQFSILNKTFGIKSDFDYKGWHKGLVEAMDAISWAHHYRENPNSWTIQNSDSDRDSYVDYVYESFEKINTKECKKANKLQEEEMKNHLMELIIYNDKSGFKFKKSIRDARFQLELLFDELLESSSLKVRDMCKEKVLKVKNAIVSRSLRPIITHNIELDYAPSFDCSEAKTMIELAICSSKLLSDDDLEMSKLYSKALLKNPDIKDSQRKWLGERKNCKPSYDYIECLRGAYYTRSSKLSSILEK